MAAVTVQTALADGGAIVGAGDPFAQVAAAAVARRLEQMIHTLCLPVSFCGICVLSTVSLYCPKQMFSTEEKTDTDAMDKKTAMQMRKPWYLRQDG